MEEMKPDRKLRHQLTATLQFFISRFQKQGDILITTESLTFLENKKRFDKFNGFQEKKHVSKILIILHFEKNENPETIIFIYLLEYISANICNKLH